MQFTTILENFDSNLWGHHIRVPDEVAAHFLKDKNRRVVCEINKSINFQCALMPKGDGTFFINLNKERRKKLGLREGTEVHVALERDNSKYGMPMPEEMKELLELDEEGSKLFHALTAGKQRSLLHIIGKVMAN